MQNGKICSLLTFAVVQFSCANMNKIEAQSLHIYGGIDCPCDLCENAATVFSDLRKHKESNKCRKNIPVKCVISCQGMIESKDT